jgi:nicotinamide phosphoribosyltransferase|nr:MAG TPA: nicotinamide phosphoribosyl transferase [Caudoviricetes sp.]
MEIFAPFAADWYKPGHKPMYNQNTKLIFSNLTPRNDKNFAHYADKNARGVIVLGLRRMVMDSMVGMWKKFFKMKREAAVKKFARMSKNALGAAAPSAECWGELHDLGYLPVEIRALPEGILSPIGIPVYTIHNTVEKFFWVTNYIETVMSTESWKTITNATAAFQYKRVAMSYALATCDNVDHVNFQCHDFSLRGLSNVEDGYKSGIAHLASFTGTDNILAIETVHEYYGIDEDQFVAGSIPASEHSVATTNISRIVKDLEEHFPHLASDVDGLRYLAEKEFLLTFITKIVPEGFCSYVADSYDYWAVLTRILPELKEEIMSRNGRLVVRPDSGDPVKVVAGYKWNGTDYQSEDEAYDEEACYGYEAVKINGKFYRVVEWSDWTQIDTDCEIPYHEAVGSIQVLWEIFGGEVNNKGYKVLDSHIGMIYGDSITVEREIEILKRLKANGFASSNIVFGVGSFTYQFNTRDTFGIAVKATGCFIDDYEIMVSKEPKTDPSKRSAKGFIKVVRKDGILHQVDNISFEEINDEDNLLQPIFRNGDVLIPQVNGRDEDFNDIRGRLDKEVMNHLIEVK